MAHHHVTQSLSLSRKINQFPQYFLKAALASGHTPLPFPYSSYSSENTCLLFHEDSRSGPDFWLKAWGSFSSKTITFPKFAGHGTRSTRSFAVDAMSDARIVESRGPGSTGQATLDLEQEGSIVRKTNSVDGKEIAKFAETAKLWWDTENGPYTMLHLMNPVRCSFIRSAFCQHFGLDATSPRPLEGLTLLDVGCGGGLLCEPLARMGARVTGIDATEESIAIAFLHAAKDPTTASIEYRCTTAEQLVEEGRQFDAVLSLEVIEHVVHPLEFVDSLSSLCRSGGATVISTINRTPRSYALAITAAEYILQWVPAGTHDWSKFLTPEELALTLHRSNLKMEEVAGMVYNPLTTAKWSLSDDLGVNYICFAVKE